jgi:hypothetical protein
MFFTTAEHDSHRQQLLDEAKTHRLGQIAKAARRAARSVATPAEPPPEPEHVPGHISGHVSGHASGHNDHADRRYPVSR